MRVLKAVRFRNPFFLGTTQSRWVNRSRRFGTNIIFFIFKGLQQVPSQTMQTVGAAAFSAGARADSGPRTYLFRVPQQWRTS
jgi:hypothetical protein